MSNSFYYFKCGYSKRVKDNAYILAISDIFLFFMALVKKVESEYLSCNLCFLNQIK